MPLKRNPEMQCRENKPKRERCVISVTSVSFEQLGESPLQISKKLNKNGTVIKNKNEKIPLEDK